MAHVTCLAAARHALPDRHGWDVERKGLAGAPHIRIVSSNHRHGSIERAVRLLGLGSDHVVDVPVNAAGQLEAKDLSRALHEDRQRPTIVVLQAGDINIGAYDPFADLIPIAHEAGAWVHIDGAFGLWAAASPTYRHLLTGVAHADSWATDGHKWLNVLYDCGYAFVADSKAHRASMSHRASYLTRDNEARDQMDGPRNGRIVDAALPPMRQFDNLANSSRSLCCSRCFGNAFSISRNKPAFWRILKITLPIILSWNQPELRVLPPVLKRFCRRAGFQHP